MVAKFDIETGHFPSRMWHNTNTLWSIFKPIIIPWSVDCNFEIILWGKPTYYYGFKVLSYSMWGTIINLQKNFFSLSFFSIKVPLAILQINLMSFRFFTCTIGNKKFCHPLKYIGLLDFPIIISVHLSDPFIS